ncbi:hypothetical protein DFJ73DRAFT_967344 [Zopfochytrium polystomum]|nr:hypothetical protein DFJ73DRAFT_967344 [Zopfochytrium polystomum]
MDTASVQPPALSDLQQDAMVALERPPQQFQSAEQVSQTAEFELPSQRHQVQHQYHRYNNGPDSKASVVNHALHGPISYSPVFTASSASATVQIPTMPWRVERHDMAVSVVDQPAPERPLLAVGSPRAARSASQSPQYQQQPHHCHHPRKQQQQQQQQQHHQQQLLVCSYPACGKTFSRKFNLQSHEKVHSDAKPFRCPVCSIHFRRKHDLQRHMRSLHSENRPWVCPYCHIGFSRSDALRRHLEFEESHKKTALLAAAAAAASQRSGSEAEAPTTSLATGPIVRFDSSTPPITPPLTLSNSPRASVQQSEHERIHSHMVVHGDCGPVGPKPMASVTSPATLSNSFSLRTVLNSPPPPQIPSYSSASLATWDNREQRDLSAYGDDLGMRPSIYRQLNSQPLHLQQTHDHGATLRTVPAISTMRSDERAASLTLPPPRVGNLIAAPSSPIRRWEYGAVQSNTSTQVPASPRLVATVETGEPGSLATLPHTVNKTVQSDHTPPTSPQLPCGWETQRGTGTSSGRGGCQRKRLQLLARKLIVVPRNKFLVQIKFVLS